MHLFAYYSVSKNWHVKLKNQTINYKPVNTENTTITENITDLVIFLSLLIMGLSSSTKSKQGQVQKFYNLRRKKFFDKLH